MPRLTPGDPDNIARIEEWMLRSSTRRDATVLRAQMDRARKRHSKATSVPLDQLERLLTRIEESNAERI